MEIIYTSITILGLTALIGMYMLTLIMRNKSIPKAATLIHGLFAVAGVVLLVLFGLVNKPGPWDSIVVLLLAALGGFILNYRDLTGKKVPKWFAILHGLLAIAGFTFLLVFAFC